MYSIAVLFRTGRDKEAELPVASISASSGHESFEMTREMVILSYGSAETHPATNIEGHNASRSNDTNGDSIAMKALEPA